MSVASANRESAAAPGAERIWKRSAAISIFVMLVWPTYFLFGMSGTLNISIPRLLMLFWVGISIYTCSNTQRRIDSGIYLDRIKIPVILFIIWTLWRVVCDAVGEDPQTSLLATILELIGVNAIAVLPIFACAGSKGLEGPALAIFAATAVFLSLAILEWLSGVNIGSFFAAYSSVAADQAQALGRDLVRDGAYRVKSLFAHPIILSQNAAALAPLLYVFVSRSTSVVTRSVALALLFMTPFVVYATQARSGIIVLFAACASFYWLTVFMRRGNPTSEALRLAIAAAASLLILSVSYTQFEDLIQGRSRIEIQSSLVREKMLDAGIEATLESPVFGYGHAQSPSIAGVKNPQGALTIDNFYLSTMIDFGFVGLAILLALYGTVILAAIRAASSIVEPFDRDVLLAMAAGSTGLLPGLYVISSWDSTIIIYLTAGFAAAAPVARRQQSGDDEVPSRSWRPASR